MKYHLTALYQEHLIGNGMGYKSANKVADLMFEEFCNEYGIVAMVDASDDANEGVEYPSAGE